MRFCLRTFLSGIFLLLLTLCSQTSFAADPFTLVHSGTLPTTLASNRTTTVAYTVTNVSSTALTGNTVHNPLPYHVTQITTGSGVCGSTFDLAAGQSCTLSLRVSAIGMQPGSTITNNPPLQVCTSANICTGVATSSDALNITVLAEPSPVSIAVTPTNVTIAVPNTQQYTATATYSDGSTADVTTTSDWASSNITKATITDNGLATALAAGSSTISASFSGLNASTPLTITPGTHTISSITVTAVTPSATSIPVGTTQQYEAIANYADGTSTNVTTSASWASSNASILAIQSSPAGAAKAIAAGSASISAAYGGIISSGLPITVTGATVTSLSFGPSPPPSSLAINTTQQYTVTANYSDGTTKDVTQLATWFSSDNSKASVNMGLVKTKNAGSVNISASYNGVNNFFPLTVTGGPPSIVSITIGSTDGAPATISIAGGSKHYTATATYSNGSTADISGLITNWTAYSPTYSFTVNATSGVAVTTGAAQVGDTGQVSISYNGISAAQPVTVTA